MANRRRASHASRKRRQGSAKAPIAVIVLMVIVVAVGVGVFFKMQKPVEQPGQIVEGTEVTFTVEQGESAGEIAQTLKDSNLITSASEFLQLVEEKDASSQLKPGTYRIIGGTSLDEILGVLTSGKTGVTLTVPEGYTVKQVASLVEETCGISASKFEKQADSASDYESDYAFLKGAYKGKMEGFLFPSTYAVPYDASAKECIKLMLDTYAKQVEDIDLSYAKSKNLSAYDVVTLASIIEKESRSAKDMAKISSVFYNRMHEGMNLGSDVTTYYGLGKDLTEELTNSDLASDNPYNTRNPNILGLPPSPICNPGIDAIKAAARPADTDYLYFFYSSQKDKVMFYKTLDEFNAAWSQYQ